MAETREIGDKVWYEATIKTLTDEFKSWGMRLGDSGWGRKDQWSHPDASFTLAPTAEVRGSWNYTRDYDVIEIACRNSGRSFTKKVTKGKTDVVSVLAKIKLKLDECIAQRRRDDAEHAARTKRETFQKAFMSEHFPNVKWPLEIYVADGDTPESIRFNVSLRRVNADVVKRITEVMK